MSRIALNGMRFYAHHGCFDEEQTIGTDFVVNLALETDTSKAEVSDNIGDTVSYLDVYHTVKAEMEKSSHLLEHVARRIVDAILTNYGSVSDIEVEIQKLNPPLGGQLDSASVKLVRRATR